MRAAHTVISSQDFNGGEGWATHATSERITERKPMQCQGTVQGNRVILEEGISLPDGIRVTVIVAPEEQPAPADITHEAVAQRHALKEPMKAYSQPLSLRRLYLGDLI